MMKSKLLALPLLMALTLESTIEPKSSTIEVKRLSEEELARIKEKNDDKIAKKQGLKKYVYWLDSENKRRVLYARNDKNAERKFKNMGVFNYREIGFI